MTTYLLIDTLNVMMRAKHVTRGDSHTKAGLALAITIGSIKSAWSRFNADHIVFATEGQSWRKKFFKDYKANRAVTKLKRTQADIEDDEVFFETMNSFMSFLKEKTNCTVLRSSITEADDCIAAWIQRFGNNPDNKFIIISTDSDYAQLMTNPNVQIFDGVNNKIYTADGIFDGKMSPLKDKKGENLKAIDPEYLLFEKCIRGDVSDNVPSANPGVRTKSSKNAYGIVEAFEDRHKQGIAWTSFMKNTWEDPFGEKHIVEDLYKRNKVLIDLALQPPEIKEELNRVIDEALAENKERKLIGIEFLKFCGKNELENLSKQCEVIAPMFSSKLKIEI